MLTEAMNIFFILAIDLYNQNYNSNFNIVNSSIKSWSILFIQNLVLKIESKIQMWVMSNEQNM